MVDPLPWILALAFADSAFKNFETVEQLWAARVNNRRRCLPLAYKEEKRDLHVFRPSQHSTKALDQKTFNRLFQSLMRQCGYTRPVSVQRIREEVTNLVDNAGVTEAQRIHTVGHSKPTFNQSYIHSLSSIDVQALFLGEEQRKDHLELLSSLSSVLIRGYPYKLPNDERDRVLTGNSEYQSLRQSQRDLQGFPDSECLQAKKKELKKELDSSRYRLKKQALKEYQKKWLEECDAEFTLNEDTPRPDLKSSRFAQLLLFAPNRLAVTATMRGHFSYSHETRLPLINCLTQMAKEHEVVLHRPGEAPVNGLCPVQACGVLVTG